MTGGIRSVLKFPLRLRLDETNLANVELGNEPRALRFARFCAAELSLRY